MPDVSVFDAVTVSESVTPRMHLVLLVVSDSVGVGEFVQLDAFSLSEARIVTLASDLSIGEIDLHTFDTFFDAVMRDLAWTTALIEISTESISSGQTSVTLPTLAMKIVAVFFEDRQLDPISLRSLESFDPQWRDRRGEPVGYVTEGEGTRTYRLYPVPDYPGTLTLFHTQLQVAVPQWLELPLAYEILSREFSRESNHRDDTMAQMCEQMSTLLLSMVQL